jgi:hypothetical protein
MYYLPSNFFSKYQNIFLSKAPIKIYLKKKRFHIYTFNLCKMHNILIYGNVCMINGGYYFGLEFPLNKHLTKAYT